jgi:hypothetical protein
MKLMQDNCSHRVVLRDSDNRRVNKRHKINKDFRKHSQERKRKNQEKTGVILQATYLKATQ